MFGVILHYIITTNRLRIFSWWGPSHHWSFWTDSGLAPQYLGGPPLGEVCLDHRPQGDRVVDDQEDAIMEQTSYNGADQLSDPPQWRASALIGELLSRRICNPQPLVENWQDNPQNGWWLLARKSRLVGQLQEQSVGGYPDLVSAWWPQVKMAGGHRWGWYWNEASEMPSHHNSSSWIYLSKSNKVGISILIKGFDPADNSCVQ